MILEWTALGITLLTVFVVKWLSALKYSWVKTLLDWFPAILFAYVIPALFTHVTGLNLASVYLHMLSREWIIPIAILLVMSALPFKQLRVVGVKPILLFVSGSFIIALLPAMLVVVASKVNPAYYNLFIVEQNWTGLVPIVGGWIGGSTSQLVLKELVHTPEGLFLSILVFDNLVVNSWTILMFQFIKRSNNISRFLKINSDIRLSDPAPLQQHSLEKWKVLVLILVITVCVNFMVHDFFWQVIILSILGLMLGNALPRWNANFSLTIGSFAIISIMAILGLRLNFDNLSLPGPLIVLVLVWLLGHFILMILIAYLLRLHVAWVAIGSMANLGGISTAPAVTAAYDTRLMPHAVLLSILSMVTGTVWGMFTIYLFSLMI